MTSFIVEPLSQDHDRPSFDSGVEPLDRYLHVQVGQDVRRRISNCFVATSDRRAIAGYYTLAAASIPMVELPEEERKRLPRYPVLPAVLIGRLAVDRRFRGQGLGSALLFDAMARAMKADPAVFAAIVDAKNESAAEFYGHFGFRRFVSRPMSLFLPLATVAKLMPH